MRDLYGFLLDGEQTGLVGGERVEHRLDAAPVGVLGDQFGAGTTTSGVLTCVGADVQEAEQEPAGCGLTGVVECGVDPFGCGGDGFVDATGRKVARGGEQPIVAVLPGGQQRVGQQR